MKSIEGINNFNSIKGASPIIINSKIKFYGENNVLFCDKNLVLENSLIEFGGSNSIVFLKGSNHKYRVSIKTFNNSTIFIDSDCYFNGLLDILVSEETNLIIGKDCMFSLNNSIMTTDHHPIYDCNTNERINLSKSIYIGDHVWVGQNSLILKNTQIDSGSIIGAGSIVVGTNIESNAIYAGNPAKCVKDNVFWLGNSVHKGNIENTFSEDTYKYQIDSDSILEYEEIENYLKKCSIDEKIEYLLWLSQYKMKNRFVHREKEANKILINKIK